MFITRVSDEEILQFAKKLSSSATKVVADFEVEKNKIYHANRNCSHVHAIAALKHDVALNDIVDKLCECALTARLTLPNKDSISLKTFMFTGVVIERAQALNNLKVSTLDDLKALMLNLSRFETWARVAIDDFFTDYISEVFGLEKRADLLEKLITKYRTIVTSDKTKNELIEEINQVFPESVYASGVELAASVKPFEPYAPYPSQSNYRSTIRPEWDYPDSEFNRTNMALLRLTADSFLTGPCVKLIHPAAAGLLRKSYMSNVELLHVKHPVSDAQLEIMETLYPSMKIDHEDKLQKVLEVAKSI